MWCKDKRRLNRQKGVYFKEMKSFCVLDEHFEKKIDSFLKGKPNSSIRGK